MPELAHGKSSTSPMKSAREGRTLSLQAVGAWQGFETELDDECSARDVVIQPLDAVVTVAGILFRIVWWRGEAAFYGPSVPLTTSNIKEYQVSARKVRVEFFVPYQPGIGVSLSSAGITVNVSVTYGQGGQKGPASAFSQWVSSPNPAVALGDLAPTGFTSGRVYEGTVNLKAMPAGAAAVWLLLFTNVAPGGLISGTTLPVPGGRSAVMTGAPATVSLLNDQSPLEFDNHVTYALSTTPDVYTAPGAGGAVTVDLYLGG